MKNTRRFRLPAFVLTVAVAVHVALLCITTGCQTPGAGGTNAQPQMTPQQLQTLASAIQLAASGGTVYAVRKYPDTKSYFIAAVAVLDELQANGKYDPESLRAAMATVSVKEIQSNADVQMGIESVFAIYQATYGQAVAQKLGASSAAPLLKALDNGIRVGVGMPVVP